MLVSWRIVTEKEYPQYVHLIPHPDEIDLSKIENSGVITDTCNSAQKANLLIDASVNGVVHSIFFHNHIRNFWVKNVLDSFTGFFRAHLNDNLEEVASELRFLPDLCPLLVPLKNKLVSVQTILRVLVSYFVN